jgi:hypothetical protein
LQIKLQKHSGGASSGHFFGLIFGFFAFVGWLVAGVFATVALLVAAIVKAIIAIVLAVKAVLVAVAKFTVGLLKASFGWIKAVGSKLITSVKMSAKAGLKSWAKHVTTKGVLNGDALNGSWSGIQTARAGGDGRTFSAAWPRAR